MKTVQEVAKICWNNRHIADIEKELKEWAKQIITECSESADIRDQIGYYGDGETYKYTAVDKNSILKVKEQL